MASHNIDIIIETNRTAQNLNNLNNSLSDAQKRTIEAAKAANYLNVENEHVAKAALRAAQATMRQVAADVAATKARRDNLKGIAESIEARKQETNSASELVALNRRLEAVNRTLSSAERDYATATQELARAQQNLNQANQPFLDAERRKAEAIRRTQEDMRRYNEFLRQGAQANREAERVRQQEAQALNRAKTSNDQYVKSLRQQLEIAKRSGVEGKIYQNQLRLNSKATREQRDEVERLTRELDKLNSKQSSTSGGGFSLGRLAAGAGLVFGASQILQWGKDALTTADNMAALQVRIRAVSSSQEEANAVFAQLVSVSNTMGVSLENTIGTFSRFAPAAKKIGATNQDVLQFVETLNKLGQVGGASAQEVESALYQLSQSFSAGKLQGQEFMVVSKTMPNVLDELARVMGVTRGELNKLASEGRITALDLLKLKDGSDELDEAFKNLPRSIEQSSQGLSNELAVAIDLINKKFGITASIAAQMDGWAQTVGRFNQYLGGSWSEADDLNKQLGILKNNQKQLVELQSQAEKGSMKYNYTTKSLVRNLQDQAVISAKIAALQSKIKEQPKPAYVQPDDPEAAKRISDLEFEISLRGKNAEAIARERAIRNAPAGATPEQKQQLGELAAQLARVKEEQKAATKAGKDAERQSKRNAEQLRKNQKANQKYIAELTATTEKHKNELDTAKSMIGTNLILGKSVDDLVFQYKNLIEIKFQNNLLSSQAESLAKLNSDATDEEKEKVIALTEALERQKIAKELAQQVSGIQGELQNELGDPFELELAKINDQEAQRLAVLDQWRNVDKENAAMYEQMKVDAMQSAARQREQVTLNETKSTLSASANMLSGFSQLISQFQSDSDNKNKAVFAAAKAFAIASAGLNFSSALMQALADPSALTLPQKLANYALVASSGAALIGQITSQNFADGGYVSGRGTGRSDEIPALLSNGEYVATSKATQRYRPQLEAMNRGTYSEDGGSRPVNIEIINTTGTRVTTQQLTEDDVRVIIGEEVPDLVGAQMQDPYSPLFRATQSSFKVERNV